MLLLGHLGITVGVAYGLERVWRRSPPWDYRLVLVGALLPDLIDKPLALAGIWGGRAIGHTILAFAVLTAVTALLVRRRWISPGWWALPLGLVVHLVLDQMWLTPSILLWPAFGFAFPGQLTIKSFTELLLALLHEPGIVAGEVVGGIFLAALIVRHKLYRVEAWRRFLREGVLPGTQPSG